MLQTKLKMTKLTFVNRSEQKQEQKNVRDIKLERRQILVELDDLPNVIYTSPFIITSKKLLTLKFIANIRLFSNSKI